MPLALVEGVFSSSDANYPCPAAALYIRQVDVGPKILKHVVLLSNKGVNSLRFHQLRACVCKQQQEAKAQDSEKHPPTLGVALVTCASRPVSGSDTEQVYLAHTPAESLALANLTCQCKATCCGQDALQQLTVAESQCPQKQRLWRLAHHCYNHKHCKEVKMAQCEPAAGVRRAENNAKTAGRAKKGGAVGDAEGSGGKREEEKKEDKEKEEDDGGHGQRDQVQFCLPTPPRH